MDGQFESKDADDDARSNTCAPLSDLARLVSTRGCLRVRTSLDSPTRLSLVLSWLLRNLVDPAEPTLVLRPPAHPALHHLHNVGFQLRRNRVRADAALSILLLVLSRDSVSPVVCT